MNAASALASVNKGPSFLPLLAGAGISLLMSAITLANNQFYQQLRDLTRTVQGGSMFDLMLGVGCFMMLLIGFLDRSKIIYAHYVSVILFAPSVLSFSQADWLSAAGFKDGFSAFRSGFSQDQLLIIGLIVLSLFLFHHALNRAGDIRDELRKAGGEEGEVNAAVDLLVLNRIWTLLLTAVATLLIFTFIEYLGPWMSAIQAQYPGIFIVVLAIAAVSVLAMFVRLLRLKRKTGETTGDRPDKD